MAAERLQKILAAAGIASRRKAEELIAEGHVSVNGTVITELGTKADSRMDEIRVDGQIIGRPERHVYFMLYKPKGVVTTLSDPEGRPTITDLVKTIRERVFPVGRLDYMSEGLLLLTNDGDLMAKLTHAKTHVPKTYMVKVSGHPTDEQIDRLRAGITLPPEPGLAGARGKKQPGVERRSFAVKTAPTEIDLIRDQENPWYQVTLIEGRNRQIRRMFEEIGFHIEKIKRIRYGTLELNVEPGELRQLSFGEVTELRKSLAKPYRIAPPRPKQEEGFRYAKTSKAAKRGFPKPERRGAGDFRKPARPAGDFKERAPRTDRGEARPPRREATGEGMPAPSTRDRKTFVPRSGAPHKDFGPRKDFGERKSFGERKPFGDRKPFGGPKSFGDRKPGFGPGKPPKRYDREGAADTRAPRGDRSPRDYRGTDDRPRTGARPSRPPSEFRERKSFGGFGPGKPRRESSSDRPSRGDRPSGSRPPREGGFRGPEGRRPGGPRSGGSRPGGSRPGGGGRSGGPRGGKGSRPGFRRD